MPLRTVLSLIAAASVTLVLNEFASFMEGTATVEQFGVGVTFH